MRIGNKEFDVKNNVYIMGILNVTPDSFSDGGKFNNFDRAMEQVEKMINEGADVIDVGGESTRPGHIQISENEEIERIVPIIKAIKEKFDVIVSIDTYKSCVALEAFKAGADLLNDVWGLLYEDNFVDGKNTLAQYAKEYGVAVCLMHNDTKQMEENNMNIVIDRLQKSVDEALKYGIEKDKIMLDPGIGFAKSYENNLYVMKHMEKINKLGYPILLGTSRKSMIGLATGEEVDNRVEGTVATTVIGVEKGAAFVRVHDVKENLQAIKMTKAIMDLE